MKRISVLFCCLSLLAVLCLSGSAKAETAPTLTIPPITCSDDPKGGTR
jgi:hypothetical protein